MIESGNEQGAATANRLIWGAMTTAATTPATTEEQHIKSLWTALQVAENQIEKGGLQFGEAMYEYREKYKRPDGLRVSCETQNSFEGLCERLNIPRATAYRWINRWEEKIGAQELGHAIHEAGHAI